LTSAPPISVVVTAHQRKKYLMEAVKSALNQTLERDLYEVIVVKDFEDAGIDQQLASLRVRTIQSADWRTGAMASLGVEAARGEVISFLDDDDLFAPQKLGRVLEAFRKGADYFHNGRLFINESGRPIGAKSLSGVVQGEGKARYLRWMLVNSADQNSSSTSIRRELLDEKTLDQVELSADTYYFVCALLKGKKLVFDPSPLTLYRVHGQQSGWELSSADAYLKRQAASTEAYYRDYSLFAELLAGTPYEGAAVYFSSYNELARLALPSPFGPRAAFSRALGAAASMLAFPPTSAKEFAYFFSLLLTPFIPDPLRRARAGLSMRLKLAAQRTQGGARG